MEVIAITTANADAVRAQLTKALAPHSHYLESESVDSVVGQIMEAVAPYVGKESTVEVERVRPKPEPEVAARSADQNAKAGRHRVGTYAHCAACGSEDIYVTSTQRFDAEDDDLFN